jgi:dUTP pyrophosphatase
MRRGFEKVKRFENIDLPLPERKTKRSAGYDMAAAEDIIIPSHLQLWEQSHLRLEEAITLDHMAELTKKLKIKPTLVSTGYKCYLADDEYLQLAIRSSAPLKHWLILANGIGIIDADYAGNESNDGEIFFQVINLSPLDIKIKKGDIIGQATVQKYSTFEDEIIPEAERKGGFGSTNE